MKHWRYSDAEIGAVRVTVALEDGRQCKCVVSPRCAPCSDQLTVGLKALSQKINMVYQTRVNMVVPQKQEESNYEFGFIGYIVRPAFHA